MNYYNPTPNLSPYPTGYPAAPAGPPVVHPGAQAWPPQAPPPAGAQPYPAQPFQPVPQQRPAPNASAVFHGISGAVASKSSNWIRAGQYILLLKAMKLIQSIKQEAILIIEATCLRTISSALGDQLGIPGHVPGEELAISYNSKHLPFLGNIKGMIAALEGVPPERIDEDLRREGTTLEAHCTRMTSDEQPYAGMVVEVSARQVQTRRGTPYTRVDWGREIRPTEIASMLSPADISRFFPGDTLARMIEAEGRIHGVKVQPQPQPQPPAQPFPLPGYAQQPPQQHLPGLRGAPLVEQELLQRQQQYGASPAGPQVGQSPSPAWQIRPQ